MNIAAKTVLLIAGLSLYAQISLAQIYKVDGDEGVVFTDRPESVDSNSTQKVEQVELSETNTVAPVTPRPPAVVSTKTTREEKPKALTVTITSPANEATIAMGPGNFSVSAAVEPALRRGELLMLTMDGQAIGAAQRSASWFVEGALRGAHDLVVIRTTSRGKTVASSEPVRVFVLRPSIIRR